MPEKDDGGSAFPCPEDEHYRRSFGMSLRDWFAGQAVIGHLATFAGNQAAYPSPAAIAELAYRVADAMLAERNKS